MVKFKELKKKKKMVSKRIVTSECVSFGHPDKIADQIADALLDEFTVYDRNTRAGIEVMVKDNIVVLGGEVSSKAVINYDTVVKEVFNDIEFPESHHLNPENIKIINLIGKQSPEISAKVDRSDENIGAGDQGFMVGYATNETPSYMPLGHYIARVLCNYFASFDNNFGPDCKTQVIVEYDKNIVKVKDITVSVMNEYPLNDAIQLIKYCIISNKVELDKTIYEKYIKGNNDISFHIMSGGEWKIGGPIADCGITGRKLAVDHYGGYCNISGGNLSGKDFSKVDRSASYMARYLAKNIVAAGIANEAKVTLSYTIGCIQSDSLCIEMDRNQEMIPQLTKWIMEHIDLSPKGIIDRFIGNGIISYYNLSKFGHFGIEDVGKVKMRPWENIDIKEDIYHCCFK